jgi:hypothetical protein
MNQRIRFVKLGACTLTLAMLTGCIIPYPHRTLRSAEIVGRILDARTHSPIQGAKIILSEHPEVSCTSDSTGHFRLKATHNFHLAVIGDGEASHWPAEEFWWPHITVWHPNYLSLQINDNYYADKGDIFLEPS